MDSESVPVRVSLKQQKSNESTLMGLKVPERIKCIQGECTILVLANVEEGDIEEVNGEEIVSSYESPSVYSAKITGG